jgi:hypothetical protein
MLLTPGDLHRVLEGEEDAFPGALFRGQFEQVFSEVGHGAAGHFVLFAARQHIRQGALAGSVRTHDGVDFTGLHFKVQAFQDLLAFAGVDFRSGNYCAEVFEFVASAGNGNFRCSLLSFLHL